MRNRIEERKMEELRNDIAEIKNAQLVRIETMIKTNEELQAFYDEIVEEVGL